MPDLSDNPAVRIARFIMLSSEYKSKEIFDSVIIAALFCVYVVSVAFVLISGIHVYRSAAAAMKERYEKRTLISYLSVKIKHYDASDSISLGYAGKEEALVLTEKYGSEIFKTYIYCYEGSVRELFIRESAAVEAGAGEIITAADDLEFEMTTPSLIKVICTGGYGETCAFIHLRSHYTAGSEIYG